MTTWSAFTTPGRQPTAPRPGHPGPESTWNGIALPVSRDRLLLGPAAAALVVALINAEERRGRALNGGGGLSPAMRELRAAATVIGHADVRESEERASSAQVVRADDLITVREAATMLDLGERQVRRLVQGGSFGPSHRIGRSIIVGRAEVAAFHNYRRHEGTR